VGPGAARPGTAAARDERELLAEDHATVVWTWALPQCQAVSLSYSPFARRRRRRAMETIELAFDDVEMA
jgi:hypothetical protein